MRKKLAQYKQLAGIIVEGKIFYLSEDEDNLRNIWEVVVAFRRLNGRIPEKYPRLSYKKMLPNTGADHF